MAKTKYRVSSSAREITTTTTLHKLWAPKVSLIDVQGFHQTTTSLLSLPLSEVLKSAHINGVDDHRKGGNHTQSYKQAKGKVVKKYSHRKLNIHFHIRT